MGWEGEDMRRRATATTTKISVWKVSRVKLQLIPNQFSPARHNILVSSVCALLLTTHFCWGEMDLLLKARCSFRGKFRRLGWKSTCRWGWGGFVHGKGERFFTAAETLLSIDNRANTPAHNLSSIRALKVLLAAHLSLMKTRRCWTWMPSYFQPGHDTVYVCSCSVLSHDAICSAWSMMSLPLIGLTEGLGHNPPLSGGKGRRDHGRSLDGCNQRLICTQ